MRQWFQCLLLDCCLAEISRPRHMTWYFIETHADQFRFIALLSQCWAPRIEQLVPFLTSLVWFDIRLNHLSFPRTLSPRSPPLPPRPTKPDAKQRLLKLSHCTARLKGQWPANFERLYTPPHGSPSVSLVRSFICRTRVRISFPEDNLSEYEWIFTKAGV